MGAVGKKRPKRSKLRPKRWLPPDMFRTKTKAVTDHQKAGGQRNKTFDKIGNRLKRMSFLKGATKAYQEKRVKDYVAKRGPAPVPKSKPLCTIRRPADKSRLAYRRLAGG